MSKKLQHFVRYLPWLILMLGINAMSALLLWLSAAEAFGVLVPLIILATVLLYFATGSVLLHAEQKKEKAFFAFLDHPDPLNEERLLHAVSVSEQKYVRMLGSVLREKEILLKKAETETEEYEEYVEGWAHETKTPLSLLTMILDNQREEIPAGTVFKLEYVRSRIQENISQILYYARLKSGRKDYHFEKIDLRECIRNVLEEYEVLLEEKKIRVSTAVPDITVFTDRRGIQFLISQIISNAVKYGAIQPGCTGKISGAAEYTWPELMIKAQQYETEAILRIQDNGIGVKACDLPYIFEKGFTGNPQCAERKATGMGLYLAKKMADDLCLCLEARSGRGKGFEMEIRFPKVRE